MFFMGLTYVSWVKVRNCEGRKFQNDLDEAESEVLNETIAFNELEEHCALESLRIFKRHFPWGRMHVEPWDMQDTQKENYSQEKREMREGEARDRKRKEPEEAVDRWLEQVQQSMVDFWYGRYLHLLYINKEKAKANSTANGQPSSSRLGLPPTIDRGRATMEDALAVIFKANNDVSRYLSIWCISQNMEMLWADLRDWTKESRYWQEVVSEFYGLAEYRAPDSMQEFAAFNAGPATVQASSSRAAYAMSNYQVAGQAQRASTFNPRAAEFQSDESAAAILASILQAASLTRGPLALDLVQAPHTFNTRYSTRPQIFHAPVPTRSSQIPAFIQAYSESDEDSTPSPPGQVSRELAVSPGRRSLLERTPSTSPEREEESEEEREPRNMRCPFHGTEAGFDRYGQAMSDNSCLCKVLNQEERRIRKGKWKV